MVHWQKCYFRESPVTWEKERLEATEPSLETKVGLGQLCRMVKTYGGRVK